MCRRLAMRFALLAIALLVLGGPLCAQSEESTTNVSTSSLPPLAGDLMINGQAYAKLQPVSSKVESLDAAMNLTDNNGIDEVYVKDAQGRLYIAYGYYPNLDSTLRKGMKGTIGGQFVDVVHVNNELNTGSEGFFSGWDDLKDVFKPLVTEHFGKLLTGLGVGTAALVGRQLLTHPFAGQTLAAALRIALPVVGTTLMRTTAVGAALTIAWPFVKAGYQALKKIYLERQKNNLHTIAMVTAETAEQLHNPPSVGADQRREMTVRDVANEAIRRTDAPAGSGATPPISDGGTRSSGARGAGTTASGNPTAPRIPILGAAPNSDPYGDLNRSR